MFERPRGGERAVLVRIGLNAPVRRRRPRANSSSWRASAGARWWRRSPVAASGPIRATSSAAARPRRSTPAARANDADLVLVDHPLSPSQERNLEKLTGRRVLDRNALILDIFAQRARSHEGKLEVELAQLKHMPAAWCAAGPTWSARRAASACAAPARRSSRPTAGCSATRVRTLTARLEKLQPAARHRAQRARRDAGAVGGAGGLHQRRQVDAVPRRHRRGRLRRQPAVRHARSHRAPAAAAGRQPNVVLADTVGFIRELPHELVAAFQSTLTEARACAPAAARDRCQRPAPRRAHRAGQRGAGRHRRGRTAAAAGLQQDRPAGASSRASSATRAA